MSSFLTEKTPQHKQQQQRQQSTLTKCIGMYLAPLCLKLDMQIFHKVIGKRNIDL